jgi:hypothetical protein
LIQGRVGAPPLTHLRDNAAIVCQEHRLAAEIWDPKGLAIPTWGLRDAALRLKNGSCEDDEPNVTP